jgi:hypothetical protein
MFRLKTKALTFEQLKVSSGYQWHVICGKTLVGFRGKLGGELDRPNLIWRVRSTTSPPTSPHKGSQIDKMAVEGRYLGRKFVIYRS